MSNLAERIRTMDRWIRFLNLNHPLGDWGEPASPSFSTLLSISVSLSLSLLSCLPSHRFSDPLLLGTTLSYVEGFNARERPQSTTRHVADVKILRYLLYVRFLCVRRGSIIALMIAFDFLFMVRGLQARIIA